LGGGINCPQVSTLDLSPVGTPGQTIPCPTCATPGGQLNAVLECIYESGWITITGVPPATGWNFFYWDCCRNTGITNLGASGGGNFILRATMFPYNATNTNPCYDSSPRFAERPQLATMIGNITTYSANAVDEEGDSLYYEWGRPLDGTTYPGTNYPYAAGYSFTNPLPSPTPPQNANNQAAILDPNSGIVSFLSFNTGSFVTVTKVSAFRCGIKIAEVFREIQITLIGNRTVAYSGGTTGLNTPPDVDTTIIFTYGFQQGGVNQYVDTVYAGDTVFTTIQATDFEFVGGTAASLPQSVSFDVTGIQLDTSEAANTGRCPFPPCAYLTNVAGVGTTVPTGFGLFNNSINFNWITDCNHLAKTVGCVRLSNTYNFVVKAFDSFCPSPAVNFFTLSIVVVAPPEMKASTLYCADVQPSGKVTLSWDIPPDTGVQDTLKYFRKHFIYRAIGAGPFALVDSIDVATTLTWTDNNVNANTGSVRYFLETKSGCDLLARPQTDTLSTMYLQVSQVGTNASLSWNPLRTPTNPVGSRPRYYVYKEQPAGSGVFNLIDSTSNTTYLDPVSVCNDSINYYIRLRNDLRGCDSRSNINGARLTAAAPTITPPSLRCVSVLPNEDIQLSWIGTLDTAGAFAEYKIYHSLAKAGPYTQIGTVTNYGANTFTHVGAQGNAQPHFYYIRTKAGCDVTTTFDSPTTSDSLSSIKLILNNATVGFADLSWNALRVPLPATSSGQYKVYRRVVPSLPWVLRGTTAALTFRDTITLCDTTIQYKVEIADASGCISTSSDSANQFTSVGDILDNPSLRCLAVQLNGDVQLTWVAPSDPDNFFSKYQIYSAAALAGPYTLVGTVNSYATTSWLHVGANANVGSKYYYLKTLSGCSGLADNGSTGDTLASIYLSVSNATLGSATLNWNAMSNPLLASSSGTYIVKRRTTGVGAYAQIGTTSNLNYIDNITTCNVPYEYTIEIADNAPCTSVSSAANGVFTYLGNVVVNPDLRCVSVQANGQIQLSFIPPAGSSANFNEFEIWRDNGTGFTKLDSVSNFASTTYLDITANGNSQSYSYYLLSQSGCTGQVNSTSNSQTLSSIYLTATPALGTSNLSWTALANPIPASSTTGQYDVWSSYNATGNLQFYGDTNRLVYSQPINNCDTTLRHQIKLADNSGCISTSNIDTNLYTYIGNIIANPDLRCVSVQSNGQIQLSFIPPAGSNTNFNEFEIWRDNGAGFTKLDSVSNFAATTYLDASANGNNQSYSYYMLTQSGCSGQINSTSNSQTLSSIYLTATPALGTANLSWTALANPIPATSTTGQYDVWSSYNATGNLQFYGDTNRLVYSQPIVNCDTTLSHQIKLADNSGCISTSNIDANLYTYLGNVINNPDLRCVSVQPNGQIQLSFIPPTGSSINFNEFEIWRDNGAGFTKLDSVSNFAATTYLDATANGNNQSYSYYMLTQSGCSGQINSASNSQTLSSIYLTATPALGTANLSWTALANPIPATSTTGQYDIWSSYNATGNLQFYGDTNRLVYSQPINNCDTTLSHQIKLADNSGCISTSNIDANLYTYLGNVINNPDLRCVSVQSNGQIQLSFIPPTGSSINFNEFEIWRDNGAGFTKLDSVSNFAATTYLDATANGNNQSYSYYMLTQSGCSGQINSASNSQTLSSIYLSTTPALGTANLNWTALANPIPGTTTTGQYDVWSSYNTTGNLQLYGDTNRLVYSQPINNCDTTIHYQIKIADNSGCISTSNIDTNLFTYIGNIIGNPELHCASVISPGGQIQLTWKGVLSGSWVNFNQFNIYRNTGTGFTLIDSVQNNSAVTYTDNTANGYNGSVSYYLVTKSGCSGQVDNGTLGNTISSIYLKVTGANTTTANLNWNAPSTPLLPNTSNTYTVEREQPAGSGNWTVAGNVTATTFTEPLTLCIDSVNYRVSLEDTFCISMSNYDGETFVDHTIPTSPELRCASVLPNGDVTLTWIAPVDTGMRFGNYQIYSSANPNGPFAKIQTVNNYNTLSYTHIGANAQNNSIYYYITTQTACGGETSPVTDTLRTIRVNVINNNGVAFIRWNPLHDPELATATLTYDVYKEYPTGTWSKIGTTTAPDYDWSDTINVCSAIINYYVSTGDQSGCISNSSIDGDLFKDITKPNVSVMDTVSLSTPTGTNVNISWIPSTSGDVEGYIIYNFNGASWDSIGAVTGANSTSFSFVDPAVQNGSQLYSIAAYDSCGNRSSIGLSQNTMFLKAKLDVCKYAIDLQWNPFINMPGGVAGYNVFVSENGGPITLLASVPATNITYSHNTLTNGSIYNYYIQVVGNDNTKTAISTQASDTANLLVLPTFGYLRKATVIDLRRVIVTAYVDTLKQPDVSKYKLQRAFEKTGPFSTVAVQTYSGLPDLTFSDFTARTNQYSYYYRIVTVDSCGNEVLISNLGRTILLSGLAEKNLTNSLKYNDYEEWLGGVSNYSLFRKIDDTWQLVPAAILPFGQQAYIDDVSSIFQTTGRFCYRVEAYEGGGNIYGFTDTSSSNEICLIQEPKVYVPSGFTPGGKNGIFKPSFIYVDAKNYFFIVFNRWGQKVFETNNPEEGWDGTFDGTLAPEGTYVYNVRIFGTSGQEIEKNGSVTLLR
jgi:gliding motility-associated-like protein